MANVKIRKSPNLVAVPDSVTIFKSESEQVTWINEAGEPIGITFTPSPFTKSSFDIPAGGRGSSGTSTAANNPYKYTVTGKTSGQSLDPEVVVEN